MPEYRKIIYENYFSNQVNKGAADYRVLLEQQAYYYSLELVPFLPENKSASIMDIGCGFGSFIKAARAAGSKPNWQATSLTNVCNSCVIIS